MKTATKGAQRAARPSTMRGLSNDSMIKALSAVIPDGLVNAMTGMGGDKDKLANTFYQFNQQSKEQQDAAYRSDWITRKGIDIPAYDATREWRTWQEDGDALTAIETLEKDMNIQRKVMLAQQRGRLYGGGALIMGVDQGTSDQPLVVENVKKGDLKFLHVVSKWDLGAGPIDWDIMSPYFGQPSYYTKSTYNTTGVAVNGNLQTGGQIKLHPSRVVRFIGQAIPDINIAMGWGDSVLQSVTDAITSTQMVSGSIAQLISEAKIDIVKIPGLSENITTQAYEDRLKKRFSVANMVKSVFSMLIVDKEEEWDRLEAHFQGMPQIIQMYLLIVCGAFDIPATRFLGQSPAGMSATGDSDTRNYYDRISTDQSLTITPAMENLDEVIIRSALGTRPPDMWYDWNPLWQMDDAQSAAIAVQKATVFTADVNAGLITPLVLQKAREAQLINDGTYPGLEALIEEYGEDYVAPVAPVASAIDPETGLPVVADPNNPNTPSAPTNPNADPNASKAPAKAGPKGATAKSTPASKTPASKSTPKGAPAKGGSKTSDMAGRIRMGDATSTLRTLYVCRMVTNQDDIKKWFKAQGFTTSLDDMHVTIVYSKSPVDWLKAGDSWSGGENDDGGLTIKPGGPRVMEQFGEATVMALANSALQYRHMSIMDNCEGATWSFDDYTPHITISYKKPVDLDLSQVKPYTGVIELGPEMFEEIKQDFDNNTDTEES